PYIGGGTAGIADPEFRFFTPTFLAQLLFGIPVGFRLAIYIATASGAIGMLVLARRVGLSVYAALVAAIIVVFGSVNLLEVVEGHPNIFAAMYIPWIFWAWLGAYGNKPLFPFRKNSGRLWPLLCGLFLALTFFQGGIYLLMYTGIAFFGLLFLVRHPVLAMRVTLQSAAWALGLAAVKLIPVLFWLSQFQDAQYVSSTYIFPYIDKILLGRILHGADTILPNQPSGWHEYGAYVGPLTLLLAGIGFVRFRRRRLIQALLVAVVAATCLASSGPILKPLFDHVDFIPRSNISRFMLFAVIPLSLLAGFGAQATAHYLTRAFRLVTITYVVLLGLLAADLFTLSYLLSEQAFVIPRHIPPVRSAPYPIAYTAHTYKYDYFATEEEKKKGAAASHPRAYEATLAGWGTLAYCSVLTPPIAVRTIHDEGDNDLFSIHGNSTDARGTFKLLSWSPNRVVARITVSEESTAILNTNYAKGWFVNGEPAREASNRVMTVV
ncbi:MAG: hypothetical protein ACRD4B_06200, partial [Acidobacteriota bacterium]